nr:NIPSNAP family protein [Planosporangium flavigriseum]
MYELRVYEAAPGKLPALHARFTDHTLRLFARHGITPVGFWTTYIGPSNMQLTYLLRWENLAEREQRWAAFSTDPEWLQARAESERDGPLTTRIENSILAPTEYSPMT